MSARHHPIFTPWKTYPNDYLWSAGRWPHQSSTRYRSWQRVL